MRSTPKNNSMREPEMRLPAILPGILITVIGLVALGCTAQAHAHWIGPLIALALLGAGTTATYVISMTHAIDSYKHMSGEVVSIILSSC